MKKLLITMFALMLVVTCCSCSPKPAKDTPKPSGDNPTLIVDTTDDAVLSTTTFFSAENSTVFTTETTAVTTSVTDITKQPTKTSIKTTSSKTAAKTTKATTKSETVTTKKTTAATTVTTRATKKTTQTTVTVPTTKTTTKAPITTRTTVKPTTAKPTTTATKKVTTTTTKPPVLNTCPNGWQNEASGHFMLCGKCSWCVANTMSLQEAEDYANAYLQELGFVIDYSYTPDNASFMPPVTWDVGDSLEEMKELIRVNIDIDISHRGLEPGGSMRAVAAYRPNEYDNTYGWLYILH